MSRHFWALATAVAAVVAILITLAVLATAPAHAAPPTAASCQPGVCLPLCAAPCPAPAPKPTPKPCGRDALAELLAMPAQALPAEPRTVIAALMRQRAPSDRYVTAAGQVTMPRTSQALTDLRLPGGTRLPTDQIGTGDVYHSDGWYVLHPRGCLPLVLATNPANPARLVAQLTPSAGDGLRPPKPDRTPAASPTKAAAAPAAAPAPEPASLALAITALLALLAIRRRARHNRRIAHV